MCVTLYQICQLHQIFKIPPAPCLLLYNRSAEEAFP
jgi:hypothetical protein